MTLVRTIWIDADPKLVRSFFLEADKIRQWTGQGAESDPRPSGIYRLDMGKAGWLEGRFAVVDAARIEQHIDLPGGTGHSTIVITLAPKAGGTEVTIEHSGLPTPFDLIAARGWDHHLARLSVAATGGPTHRTACVQGR